MKSNKELKELKELMEIYDKFPKEKMSDWVFLAFILLLGALWLLKWFIPFWIILWVLLFDLIYDDEIWKAKRMLKKRILMLVEKFDLEKFLEE